LNDGNTIEKAFFLCFLPGETGKYFETKKGTIMRVNIEDTCTACGLCVDTCPEVFEMGDDMAQVIVDEVPAEYEDAVQQAADECPVEAIIVE
jgi:ferredoxin